MNETKNAWEETHTVVEKEGKTEEEAEDKQREGSAFFMTQVGL